MNGKKFSVEIAKKGEHHIHSFMKNNKNLLKIALGFPNSYYIGMSNLGFQWVYYLLNSYSYVKCERFFFDSVKTVESNSNLLDFDIIAFSISYEIDYLNMFSMLVKANINPIANHRKNNKPLLISGGIAVSSNPEPVAEIFDLFIIGEFEEVVDVFMPKIYELFKKKYNKGTILRELKCIPGIYIPSYYDFKYDSNGKLSSIENLDSDSPSEVCYARKHLMSFPAHSAILTNHTIFKNIFLVELARGCPYKCKFCLSGYLLSYFRKVDVSNVYDCIIKHCDSVSKKVGFIGNAFSSVDYLDYLCRELLNRNIKVSFSSIYIGKLGSDCLSKMSSVQHTFSLAPDGTSEKIRKFVNKEISDERISNSIKDLISSGAKNIKLYYIIGLPTETDEDICSMVDFIKQFAIKMGNINFILSINPFIPKPHTPFQRENFCNEDKLRKRINIIKTHLGRYRNVKLKFKGIKISQTQAILSRGDRRLSKVLTDFKNHCDFSSSLEKFSLNPELFTEMKDINELLPWEIIKI